MRKNKGKTGFRPIGDSAYKRVGVHTLDYRVIYRRDGIYLNEKLTSVKDDEDARTKANARVTEVRNAKTEEKHVLEKSPLVTFESIMDQVIASKAWPPTRKTVEYYLKRVVLPILEKHCPYVSEFGPTGPEDFVTWFQCERPGEKFFNPRKYFLQVLKRAKKLGLLNPKVELEIANPDPERRAGKVYSESEMKALLTHAGSELQLQILMAYSTGMRKSEILKLKWDRFNLLRQTIALLPEDTKIRRGREFKVNDTVWALLMVRRSLSKSAYVFPSSTSEIVPVIDNKTAWTRCKKQAGVKGRFHDLRHTFLTEEVARKKHQAMDVCEYAGLSLDELRETYLHSTYVDTAYIADSQDEKLESIIPIKKVCNTFCNNSTGGIQYV
jgi:integrase